MKIINHRLHDDEGQPYPFHPTPNMSNRDVKHIYLVMHYTAGPSAEQAVNWLTNPQAKASAHLVIGRDGSIAQLVPFDKVAWHAGRSSWQGLEGLNNHSLGIELDNAGPLNHGADGRWYAWFGDIYSDEAVIEATHKHEVKFRGWHMYTRHQLYIALEVANLLITYYQLEDVVGHDDIAPGRKIDPGPAFPMNSFRSRLFGRLETNAQEEIYRTVVTLNIRSGPGTQYETLAAGPLPTDTRLQILGSEGLWKQVDVLDEVRGVMDMQGWVHGRFITRA
jgi:N-acetylmuramoyl-L-alanine amidase